MRTLEIVHHTQYNFSKPVQASPHIIRLNPTLNYKNKILEHSLQVFPEVFHQNNHLDVYGNPISRLVFLSKIEFLTVEVKMKVEVQDINPFDFFLSLAIENYPFKYPNSVQSYLQSYLEVVDDEVIEHWLKSKNPPKQHKTLDYVTSLNKLVHQHLNYTVRLEPGVYSPKETIEKGGGSCRDYSWLLVNMYRMHGIAARFVSGYLIDLNFEVDNKDQLSLHAWVEVYLPGAGWLGLDPTSGLLVTAYYIPLCAVPHYKDAAAISGNTEVCEVSMSYLSSVSRLE